MLDTFVTITVVWCALSIPVSIAVGRYIRSAGKLAARADVHRRYGPPRQMPR
jgi:hypothetical protein